MQKIFYVCFVILFANFTLYSGAVFAKKSISITTKAVKKPIKKLPLKQDDALVEFPSTSNIPKIEIDAQQAIVVDDATGTVILQKNADELMHPSSMTKIMTAYLIIEKIKAKIISDDTIVTIGKQGWKTEGSSMFLNINDKVKVIDLLRGIIIQSGNDASIVMATYLSGSEDAFAQEMTESAHKMGAVNTTFKNSTGLPQEGHKTTARDLSIMARRAVHDHPEYYKIYSEKSFSYNNIAQGNRNPLLYKDINCDGIKTGHSEAGGYGLVASCVNKGGSRFIIVINGMPSMQSRADEALKIANWAMQTFTNVAVLTKGQVVAHAKVQNGMHDEVAIISAKDEYVTIPNVAKNSINVNIAQTTPIIAPIKKGDILAEAIISSPHLANVIKIPLVADQDIAKARILKIIKNKIYQLIWGK